MLSVGTKVKFGNDDALIEEVDNDDPILPYRIVLRDGTDRWVAPYEFTDHSAVYEVTEADIAAKEVGTSDGWFTVNGDWFTTRRDPDSIRDDLKAALEHVTNLAAVLRFIEEPDRRAKEIYYEAYPPENGHLDWDETDAYRRDMARKLAEKESN